MWVAGAGRAATIAVLAAGALAVASPSADAGGLVFEEMANLAERERKPAPLVPIALPRSLDEGEGVGVESGYDARNGSYLLRFKPVGTVPKPGVPLMALADNGPGSLAKARARLGPVYSTSPTRVRGHRGLTFRARSGPVQGVIWSEDGRMYEMGTGAPRAISLSQVRTTATGMRHLLGAFGGEVISADGGQQQVEAVLVEGLVNFNLSWTAPCTLPGAEVVDRSGSVQLGWVALAAGAFNRPPFAVATPRQGSWTLAVSGSASAAGGQVNFQAASAAGAEQCSISPVTLGLKRFPRFVQAG